MARSDRQTPITRCRRVLPLALAAAFAGCGGGGSTSGGGGSVTIAPGPASSPAPSPTPTPASAGATDRIIGAASMSQTFADEGRYPLTDGGLTVRFDAPTGHYLVTYPETSTPIVLVRDPQVSGQVPWSNFVTADSFLFVLTRASAESTSEDNRYAYSNLAAWGSRSARGFGGATAFGMSTEPAGVPVQGTVTYTGFFEGVATETYRSEGGTFNGLVLGPVTLTFDVASGIATISAALRLGLEQDRPLDRLSETPLTWSAGSPTFFQANADPANRAYPISGRFTGPAAQELIGGLRIEYRSQVDGSMQTAGGAFIAKRRG